VESPHHEAGRGGGLVCGAEGGHEEASEKHSVRVRMLFSIYEAAQATTVAPFACQGFRHAGLVPWNVSRPMGSLYINWGALPRPLRRYPFDGPPADAARKLGELFTWTREGLFPVDWFKSY
jgi:hypothetical protein